MAAERPSSQPGLCRAATDHLDRTDTGFDILRGQLLSQLWYALERKGLTLPYPIRELRSRALPESVDDPAGVDQLTRLALLRDNVLFEGSQARARIINIGLVSLKLIGQGSFLRELAAVHSK